MGITKQRVQWLNRMINSWQLQNLTLQNLGEPTGGIEEQMMYDEVVTLAEHLESFLDRAHQPLDLPTPEEVEEMARRHGEDLPF